MTNWVQRAEEFKVILSRNNDPDNEVKSVEDTKRELFPYLKRTPCFARLPKSTLDLLNNATTFYTINRAIDKIYDFADDNKIWLGLMY